MEKLAEFLKSQNNPGLAFDVVLEGPLLRYSFCVPTVVGYSQAYYHQHRDGSIYCSFNNEMFDSIDAIIEDVKSHTYQ